MKKILSLFIIVSILLSCKKKNEDSQVDQICICYSDKTIVEIDKTFNSCLNEVYTRKEDFLREDKILSITKKLIKSCPKYQDDFDRMLLSRYERRREVLNLKDIDSIENLIQKNINARC